MPAAANTTAVRLPNIVTPPAELLSLRCSSGPDSGIVGARENGGYSSRLLHSTANIATEYSAAPIPHQNGLFAVAATVHSSTGSRQRVICGGYRFSMPG